MSVDNFISAIKVKRDEAISFFNDKAEANGGVIPTEELVLGVDSLVGTVLDTIEEQYGDIITAATDDGEDVAVTCASDLSTLYFEEVSN